MLPVDDQPGMTPVSGHCRVPRPGPLPESLSASGFSVQQARRQGVSRKRLRARDLSAPYYGVRVAIPPSDPRSRAIAYAARMPPSQFFSHTTAAQLHGLRMPEGFRESALHVSALKPAREPRAAGIIGHGATGGAIILIDDMRVLSAIDSWCQLAATLTLDDLVVMGDGLVERKQPLSTIPKLQAAVTAYSGRGCRKLREALSLLRGETDSARETMLRLIVARAGFPEPEVNGVIMNSFGEEIAHGDLVFRAHRVILEYEGRQHSENPRQFAIDIARIDALMEQKWRVIRVDRALMARRAMLLGKINRALRDGGWTPPS